ncbi:PLP-dependent aminotransferase family protein [Salipiger mucosus]|uniref:Transcriptional regulator, GntR family n=1 Tax=Salipiger mucosus DSM 16094 TaxID=1123237 RepID=S9QA15_9RHOB|nr:PLP-dependent aminotransferase family protein [Salipiger mucosus]EPX76468.1 transcriptional regulator, GntR family [Salipiger mucosus DSM 16094]
MPVQLYRDLLSAIRGGELAAGALLPSSRAAAGQLDVSRSTINEAYDLLRSEGVLRIRPGAVPEVLPVQAVGASKRPAAAPSPSARGAALAEERNTDSDRSEDGTFIPGLPDEALFPADEWARLLRRAARSRPGGLAGYRETFGHPALRAALAERLAADRGVRAAPEQILITPGTQASLHLIAQVMTDPGARAAMEDPGFPGARAALHGAGLRIAPVPIDGDGMRPDRIPKDARLIYVTPSNQYPLGARLSLPRRLDLLERARHQDALILEDDYDSEFLWRGREIAALAAHGVGGEVVYMGSAAKVLMPALRIGWMKVPEALVEPLRRAHRNMGLAVNLHAQAALAEMMRSGRYRAHLRRIARSYEARGMALADALQGIDALDVTRPDGGVQLSARFVDGRPESAVLSRLAIAGYRPAALSSYAISDPATGLVAGYSDATPDRVRRFTAVLADALRGVG